MNIENSKINKSLQEFLDPGEIAVRLKTGACAKPQYKVLPDPDSKPLIDLSSLLVSLRERAKLPSQPLNDEENENE